MKPLYQSLIFALAVVPAVAQTGGTGGLFTPLTPCRVFDSRNANGDFGGPAIAANTYRTIPVQSSPCVSGINGKEYIVSYVLNITVVPIGGVSVTYLQVLPTGATFPTFPMMESADAQVYAHGAIVAAGTSGSITVLSNTATHLVIDISGYFSPVITSGGAFKAVTPCRAVETRPYQTIAAGTFATYDMTAAGCSGSITYYARAYILNITAIPKGGGLAYLTAYPAYATRPLASVLNASDGNIVANFAIIPGGGDGNRYVSFYASNDTDLVVDVVGYFTADLNNIGTVSYWLNDTPTVVMDGTTLIPYNTTATATLPNPTTGSGPYIDGWFMNLTAISPQWALYYMTAWQSGASQPLASTLNDWKAINMSNSFVIPSTGGLNVYTTTTTYARVVRYGHFEHAH